VVEIKGVEAKHPVHHAQLPSCARLSGKSVGLLINFYVAHLRDGMKRMVELATNKIPFLCDRVLRG
jgi:GxxExxY protein